MFASRKAASGLSSDRPIELQFMVQNTATPSLSPSKPISPFNPPVQTHAPRLSTNKPMVTPSKRLDPQKPKSTGDSKKRESSLSANRPILAPAAPSPVAPTPAPTPQAPPATPFLSVRELPSENYYIERESQLIYMLQSSFASKTGPEPEPVIKRVEEAELVYTSQLAGKYSSTQAILPTNQIEHEIQALQELYAAQFIRHVEYEERISALEAALKYSFESIVPHVEAIFSESRRPVTGSTKNRNARLFISSTFSDMHEDREVIMKKVIPKLHHMCKERGVVLSVVDLRWGITSEQSSSGQTLNLCLKEIDRCRPYFLCLLGNRYGWAQPPPGSGKPVDSLLRNTFEHAIHDFSWTEEFQDRSITELEVRHAVLRHPDSDTSRRALFFMRGDPVNDDDKRLTALKDQIFMNPDLKSTSYTEPEDLATLLTPLLEGILQADFPLENVPSHLERERMSHEAFQEARSTLYIGRQYYFDTINAHLANPSASPLVVIGESGSGKSALVCNWVCRYRETHVGQLVLAHYIGSTAASSELGGMLARILGELKEFFKIEKEIPSDLRDLVDQFPQWLSVAAQRGGFVLVFDALNQLDPQGNAQELHWLPCTLPFNVKLVMSTLPGKTRDAIRARNWSTLEVRPLTSGERKSLATDYLSMAGKTLTDRQLQRIIEAKQCASPLYLRVLLEEIQSFGVYERLNEHIESYLRAQDPPQLFALVFARLEKEFESHRPGLVGDMLALLWASRRGLTEGELQCLLQISSAVWSPLSLAFRELVVSKSGYLVFFHDYMKQAVEKRYLLPNQAYKHYHRQLAKHFAELPESDPRKFEEAPYQLEAGRELDALRAFLLVPHHFLVLVKTHKFDLYRFWRAICSPTTDSPANQLTQKIATQSNINDVSTWSQVSTFLQEMGEYEAAQQSVLRAIEAAQRGDLFVLLSKWVELAYILRLRGKYSEAAEYYLKAIKHRQAMHEADPRFLAQTINSLAILYRLMGKYKEAEPLYKEALSLRQALFGNRHEDIAQSLNSLGCLNQEMGHYAIAESYLQEAIALREQLLGNEHPDVAASLNNLGGVYLDWSKYAKAEPAYRRALAIYESVFGSHHPLVAKSYNSLASLMNEQGSYAAAEDLYKKSLALKEELLGPNHPDLALTLNDFAVLYSRQDKFELAQQLYQRALDIRQQVLGQAHPDYAQSLKNLASCYQDQLLFTKALPLFQQAVDIVTKAFGPRHQEVASCLCSLSGCLQQLSQYNEAEGCYERAISLLIELNGLNHGDVALAYNDMAVLQWRMGNTSRAQDYYMKGLNVYQNVYGLIHPHVGTATLNVANFFKMIGDFEMALKFFQQYLQILEGTIGPDTPKTRIAREEIASLTLAVGQ